MNRTEAQRLAASINALRPDWPVKSLMTLIETELHLRSYRDAAVALAYVATDPGTRTPKRVAEAGPWWAATPGQSQPQRRLRPDEICRECGKDERACRRIAALADDGHEFLPLTAPPANVDPVTGEIRPRAEAIAELRALIPTPEPDPVPAPLAERHDALGLPDPDVLREPEPVSTEGDS